MWRLMLTGILLTTTATATLHAGDTAPDGWTFQSIRPETAARSSIQTDKDGYGLVIAGNGDEIGDGRWVRDVSLPDAQFVRLSARYRGSDIPMPSRNVLAGIVWLNEQGKEAAIPDFAATDSPADAAGWRSVEGVFPVPPKAKSARIELRLRWAANAQVEWRDVKLDKAAAPAARKIKVASVNHRPRGNKSAQDNLNEFARFIDQAGAAKADIVCLPEAITLIGRGSDYLAAAEPIPGPATRFLGECAARNHTYIVAGLLERDGKAAYNTAVLIDRQGKLVGKYHKVCLPRSESDGGLAPGSSYPVFQTDFGKIGLMICWDVSYPEVARALAKGGAEMILMPIWGGNETLCRARAIENQVPLVISGYDIRSAIYDEAGEPKAQAPDTSSTVVYSDLDLSQPMNWKWTGHWRSRIWIECPAPAEPAAPKQSVTQSRAD